MCLERFSGIRGLPQRQARADLCSGEPEFDLKRRGGLIQEEDLRPGRRHAPQGRGTHKVTRRHTPFLAGEGGVGDSCRKKAFGGGMPPGQRRTKSRSSNFKVEEKMPKAEGAKGGKCKKKRRRSLRHLRQEFRTGRSQGNLARTPTKSPEDSSRKKAFGPGGGMPPKAAALTKP
jgi:hypothetical protein